MNKEMEAYFKKHVKSDNGFVQADSKKSAIIISLIPRTTMYGDFIYWNGKQIIQYVDT